MLIPRGFSENLFCLEMVYFWPVPENTTNHATKKTEELLLKIMWLLLLYVKYIVVVFRLKILVDYGSLSLSPASAEDNPFPHYTSYAIWN